jgi:hypothetical protein
MTPRELIKLVRAMQGDEPRLLRGVAASMRAMRGLPTDEPGLSATWLDRADVRELLSADDALGQIYQASRAGALERAYRATARERRKFRPREIPAVTGLFTPRWIVEFLLHNTLGRLWQEMHPNTRLTFGRLVRSPLPVLRGRVREGALSSSTTTLMLTPPPLPSPGEGERQQPATTRVADIRVLDPACGTMNFGVIAVEMLAAMYREERQRAGEPGWPAVPSIDDDSLAELAAVKGNLYGVDIDDDGLALARTTLELKVRRTLRDEEINLRRADALWNRALGRERFHVIVMNPPYLSARNLPPSRVRRLKRAFGAAWRDLYACFLQRGVELLADGGRLGALAMQSFMFTGGFEGLRAWLHQRAAVEAIAHFGPGVFGVGNPGTLQTAAVVMRREPAEERRAAQDVRAFRLVDVADKEAALRTERHAFRLFQRDLVASPRQAWVYWLAPRLRAVFHAMPRLREIAPPRQGLATTDNARFVRYWWEVQPTSTISGTARAVATPGRWFPYVKAGRFRRWHESPRHRVNWEDDGREIKAAIVRRYPYLGGKWGWVAKNSEYYGRGGGVTYSYLTSGRFSARALERGAIFDVAGSSLFPADLLTMLAVLNSSMARELLAAINPTVNFQVGDLAELPVPPRGSEEIRQMVRRLIEIQREIDRGDETAPEFERPMDWESGPARFRTLREEITALESQVDAAVAALYGIDAEVHTDGSSFEVDRVELARAWISFALRRWFERGDVMWVSEVETLEQVRDELRRELDRRAAIEIERTIGGIDRWLGDGFVLWHTKRFRGRPVTWAFERRGRRFLVPHDRATADVLAPAFGEMRARLPKGWERRVDDGIVANTALLARWMICSGAGTHPGRRGYAPSTA